MEICHLIPAGKLQRVRELLNSFDLSSPSQWSEGYDLLTVALRKNHGDIAKLLLLNGCKVNNGKQYSDTPLHYAAKSGDIETAEMLLERNAQINAQDERGQTPLHYAIANTNMSQVKIVKLLLNWGASVNSCSNDGVTPLHVASKKNSFEVAELLLNCGAFVNAANSLTCRQNVCEGYTPLHYAVKNGGQQVTSLLLRYNADINIKALCETPLHSATEEYRQIALDPTKKGISVHSECAATGYTPLHVACSHNKIEAVRLLLSKGADINSVATGGQTPLHVATKKRNKGIVKVLLQHEADVDVQDIHGKTVLYCAVEQGYSAIIKEILKFCPDHNNWSNRNSLKRAIYVFEEKYRQIVEILLEYGFNVNSDDTNNGRLLHAAVRSGYLKIVQDLLQYGADVNIKSKQYYTLLHSATIYGQEKMVELLIRSGANVNAEDETKRTPIVYAVRCNYLKIVELLLASGANTIGYPEVLNTAIRKRYMDIIEMLLPYVSDINVNDRDKLGRTALYCTVSDYVNDYEVTGGIAYLLLNKGASPNIPSGDGTTILHAAIENGCEKIVKTLLTKYNVDVNTTVKGGITPLHASAQIGNETIVQLLIKKGAIVDAKKKDGTTALHIAVHQGHEKIVKILLNYGADVNSRTHNDDSRKYHDVTPLHLAALRKHPKIVNTLLTFNANVNSIDEFGRTALHIASRLGHKDIITALLQNHSDINIRSREKLTGISLGLSCMSSFFVHHKKHGVYVHDLITPKVVVQHIVKLRAKNIFVHETYLDTINANPNLRHYFIECEEEIKEMRIRNIRDTDFLFYDLLIRGECQLEVCTRNRHVVKVFSSRPSRVTNMFPIYGDELNIQFRKGIHRRDLLKSSIKILNLLLGYKLPYVLANLVLSYLSNFDLRNLIDACPYDEP